MPSFERRRPTKPALSWKKAWDWQDGQLMLYAIAEYEGEWYGPLEVPK